MVAIRAHFDGKVIVPEEPLDLPAGRKLVVHIEPAGEEKPQKPVSALEWMEQNATDDPSLPTDGAEQHDHYLYRSPKRR